MKNPGTALEAEAAGHPVDRPVRQLQQERADEVAALAKKMARAAGPQKVDTMARACYMLLCTAAMVKDPDGYFKWLEKHDAR